MADHLGAWWCRYCHYRARSLFLWRKHLDNFHDGIDPRGVTHVEPASDSLVCFVCRDAGAERVVICPTLASLVEHVEVVHYRSLEECEMPLVWNERIGAGFDRLLSFEAYCEERDRA